MVPIQGIEAAPTGLSASMPFGIAQKEAEQLKRLYDFKLHKIQELAVDRPAMGSLIAKGYVQKDGIGFLLTPSGQELCKQLFETR
jgi:hypothetical protein